MTRRTATRTTRTTRRLTGIATLALLAGSLTACGGDETGNEAAVRDDGSVDLSQVTLIAGDQRSSAQEALLEAAGLDDTEYTIDWREFTAGPPMLEALDANSIHVGYVGNTPPIFAAAGGTEFQVVQAISYGGEGDAILVPDDSPFQSVADLRGAGVAVVPGSSANYNLLAQLQGDGLAMSDVEIENVQPADALSALAGGNLEAWAVWEPFTSQAEVEEGARVISTGDGIVNGYNFQVASQQALDDPATEAAIEDYVERITEAQVWAAEHPEEWAEVWAEQTGLSPEITLRAVKKRPLTVLPVDQTVIDSEQEMADAFTAEELIPEVDLTPFFDDRYADLLAPFVEQTADNADAADQAAGS